MEEPEGLDKGGREGEMIKRLATVRCCRVRKANGVTGAGPKEGTMRPLPAAKKQGEKSPGFSLLPASNSHHGFPLAESNRKPVSKGIWEM